MQASRTVSALPAWRTRMVSPSPIETMVVLAGWATATAGHDSATNVATPSRNFLAIAGVCTGSLFMLLLHDLVAAG
jgi:hypothetical protein